MLLLVEAGVLVVVILRKPFDEKVNLRFQVGLYCSLIVKMSVTKALMNPLKIAMGAGRILTLFFMIPSLPQLEATVSSAAKEATGVLMISKWHRRSSRLHSCLD